MRSGKRLQTVAETSVFVDDIDSVLTAKERDAVIASIAADPAGGDLVPGTGGLRKRRVALPGRGKRGGARVITLYLGEERPVYALLIFAKNERSDLSPQQRRILLRLVEGIKAKARMRTRQ